MLKKTVIVHFSSVMKIAQLLGITHSAVCQWGCVIPKGRALELEKLTDGALKCDLNLYKGCQHKNKRNSSKEA